MDIKLKYRYIFYDLFKSDNGLLAYTLHRRYQIEPSEAVDFMNQYEADGIITVDDELRIKLTNKGRESMNEILAKFQNLSSEGNELSYLDRIKINDKIDIFEPYLPDILFYFRYKNEGSNKETSK